MNWFLIALIGPILWAIVNHIDKYLLSNSFKGSNVGALMLFSTLASALILPILYFINNDIFNLSTLNILILIVVGIMSGLSIMPYMYALDSDEASIVVPLFQFAPICCYFLAFVILGETLNWIQIIGCLFIILGSIIITIKEDIDEKIKFRKRTILLMLLSTILIASQETLFKLVAVDSGFVISTFWEQIGLLLMGVVLFFFFKKYRTNFIHLLKIQGKKILSLNLGNEFVAIIGNLATNFALILAPVVLVLTVNSFQPLFVFLFGVIFTVMFPKFCHEKLSKKHIAQKIIAILVIVIGSLLMNG
jgi:drug/metabolite transporter (DMT)-like permease